MKSRTPVAPERELTAPGALMPSTPAREPVRPPERRSSMARRRDARHFLFLAPAVLFVLALLVYPLIASVRTSLHSSTGDFIGLANYRRFFDDPLGWSVTVHTFVRGIFGVAPSYVVGLLAALALSQRVRFLKTMTVLALVPFVISPPVALNMWKLLLDPQTGVPAVLGLHIDNVFTNPSLVWPVLIFINTWGSFQFYAMILIAAIRRIPPELYEAAAVDGAGAWQRFLTVTLPGILPASMAAAAIHFMASFQEFNLVYILTGGGPLNQTQTLATYAYQSAFTNNDMGYATTLTTVSTVLMALSLGVAALAVVGRRAVRRRTAHVVIPGSRMLAPARQRLAARKRIVQITRPPKVGRTSRPRRRTSSGYVWVVLLALYSILPILFLLSSSLDRSPQSAVRVSLWPRQLSLDNFRAVLSNPDLWSNANIVLPPLALNFLNSIIVTGCATFLIVVLGMLAGYGLARMQSRVGRTLLTVFVLLQLVPVIVLVFPLYDMLASVHLLGTQAGLVYATAAIFLPMGVLFFKVFFDSVPLEMEEAAAVDGAGLLRTFWSVVLPNSKPVVAAVGAFALINTWNEFLLASTLISNSRIRTLPPALNQYMSSYNFASSASPGMQAVYLLIPVAAAVGLLALTQRHLTAAYEGGGVKG